MTGTFDVGFEEYIIFHRGIQRIEIRKVEENGQEVEHLFVIYQDETEQDIGDPYGDQAREAAAAAEAAQLAAEQAQATIDAKYDTVSETADAAAASYNQATALNQTLLNTLSNANSAIQSFENAQTIASNVSSQSIGNVNGINYNENTGEYDVAFPDTITNEYITSLFSGPDLASENKLLNASGLSAFLGMLKNHINFVGTCSSTPSSRTKTVTIQKFTLTPGCRVTVDFTAANTAVDGDTSDTYLTLNVNSTGANRIIGPNGPLTQPEEAAILHGHCDFVYSGAAWNLVCSEKTA